MWICSGQAAVDPGKFSSDSTPLQWHQVTEAARSAECRNRFQGNGAYRRHFNHRLRVQERYSVLVSNIFYFQPGGRLPSWPIFTQIALAIRDLTSSGFTDFWICFEWGLSGRVPSEGLCDVQLVVCMGECTQTYLDLLWGGGQQVFPMQWCNCFIMCFCCFAS